MLDENLIAVALGLINHMPSCYTVQRYPTNRELFGATIKEAFYHDGVLTLETAQGYIRLSGFEQFSFDPTGAIQIFASADDERAMFAISPGRVDDGFLTKLEAAKVELGMPERPNDGLEAVR